MHGVRDVPLLHHCLRERLLRHHERREQRGAPLAREAQLRVVDIHLLGLYVQFVDEAAEDALGGRRQNRGAAQRVRVERGLRDELPRGGVQVLKRGGRVRRGREAHGALELADLCYQLHHGGEALLEERERALLLREEFRRDGLACVRPSCWMPGSRTLDGKLALHRGVRAARGVGDARQGKDLLLCPEGKGRRICVFELIEEREPR